MSSAKQYPLLKIAAAWLDPDYPLRQQAIISAAPEFCLSTASFEWALDWIFHLWTPANIEESLARNPVREQRYAVQVLACTTPAMIAQGFFQGAALGILQTLKIPAQQPTFARLLLQSFRDLAPELASRFELCEIRSDFFYQRLSQADLALIYGADETLEVLRRYLSPQAQLIAHGQAESAALIFKEAAHRDSLEKLAWDFLSYDQRGCLSPRVVFIEKGGELTPADCATLFAEELLPAFAKRYPRGGLFSGEAAEILHQRCVYGFRGQVYTGEDWTICYDEKPDYPSVNLPRFLPFKSFENATTLRELLKSRETQLLSLGYAGSPSSLRALNFSSSLRLCPLGEMQKQLLLF